MSSLADLFSSEPVDPTESAGSELLVRYQSLEDIFEEIPVGLDVFIKDKKYLGENYLKLSPIQADAVKHIERVYFQDMYPRLAEHEAYWGEDLRMTNYHAIQWGKSGGKDMICRMSSLRIAYLLMCMKSPQNYFGMPSDDSIHLLNVAISADQAQKAFFTPLTKNVAKGWFKDRANASKNSIEYDKNIECISGHSRTDSQEGLNLILGVCDEIDGFKTKDELSRYHGASARESSNSAEAIIEMMETSANTRFPETFKFVAISWPRYVGSTIQRLTKEAKQDIAESNRESAYYASGPYATWEVRPDRFKSQFKNQYKKDARTAAAKYECNPSYSINPYFRNEIQVRDCMVNMDTLPIEVSYVCQDNVWKPIYDFAEDFYPVQGAIYAMHADLAVTGDRAGVAMSHVVRKEAKEKDIFEEDGTVHRVTDFLPYVKVDFVIAYEADISSEPAREIQIRWARDLWAELKLRGFNIRQFSFDGYQSTESRQELELLGIEAPLISTDRSEEPWKNLRDLLYGGRITVPYSELLLKEIMGLTKRQNGKVDHQTGQSKDAADALACSAVGAIQLGGQEDKSGARAYYSKPEFITFAPSVDFLEGKTLQHLAWGTETHDSYAYNPDSWGF